MSYDARCEIFSLGVVLLEVLSGKIQNEPDSDGSPVILEELLTEGTGVSGDTRAGSWPGEVVSLLLSLASDCVAPYKQRIDSMLVVMRRLTAIYQLPSVTALDETILSAHMNIATDIERMRLQKEIDERLKEERSYECCVCFDEFVSSQGVLCSNTECSHFYCNVDFSGMLQSQCRDLGKFIRSGCRVICAMCRAQPVAINEPLLEVPFDMSAIGLHSDAVSLAAYVTAHRDAEADLGERRRQAEVSRLKEKHDDEIQSLREQVMVDRAERLVSFAQRHRGRIIESILTLKCPHCETAVLDFDGCFAIEHRPDDGNSRAGCGRYFCGWCLAPSDSNRSCHSHVIACPRNPHQGSYSGTYEEFTSVHAESRREQVLQYLRDLKPAADERKAIVDAVRSDLRDLGIRTSAGSAESSNSTKIKLKNVQQLI